MVDTLTKEDKKKLEKFINEKQFESPKQAKRAFERSNAFSPGAKAAIASEFGLKPAKLKDGTVRKNLFRLKNGRFF